jgi:hypothetical protein
MPPIFLVASDAQAVVSSVKGFSDAAGSKC